MAADLDLNDRLRVRPVGVHVAVVALLPGREEAVISHSALIHGEKESRPVPSYRCPRQGPSWLIFPKSTVFWDGLHACAAQQRRLATVELSFQ